MQLKDFIKYFAVTLIGFILLNLFSAVLIDMREAGQQLMAGRIVQLHVLATFYCFLLGVLVEWRPIVKLVAGRLKLNINRALIPGILLLLISLIHPVLLLQWGVNPNPAGGFGINMITDPFIQSANGQNLLSVISGIIIIRGLYKKSEA